MQTSICAGFDYNIPFDRVIPMIRQAGFEAVSLGARPQHSNFHTAEGRSQIKKLVVENGLALDYSVHAPFPEGDQLFSLEEPKRLESVRQCQIGVDAAADLNGRNVVLHLIPYGIPPGPTQSRMIEQGLKSVRALADYAVEKGIKLALENGQQPDYDQVLEFFLAEFSGGPVGFCYDSGHENVKGTCFKILEKFGHRLLSVHLHDNVGSDTHVLPFEGNIDWNKFRKIFHKLDYSGNLLLEVDIHQSQFKNPQVFLSEARRRAERLLQPPA